MRTQLQQSELNCWNCSEMNRKSHCWNHRKTTTAENGVHLIAVRKKLSFQRPVNNSSKTWGFWRRNY